MGFYGNITNTSNTTFSFDRIYPNRLAMDANANNDGIFIGRYVLVEYEQSAAYPNIYINNGKYYSSPNFEEATRIKYKSGGRPASDTSNDVFYLGEFGQKQESEKIYFYMCDGYEAVEENLYATFKQVTAVNKDDATPYLINHNIDYEEYKNAKGYDSSVWTKVNEEKNGKLVTRYRNIADLNSVVPTFDIAADAPTMTPITPHFDADSTNVYYKLHMQSPYGFRVKQGIEGQSDDDTVWYRTTYNKEKDETKTEIVYDGPADIYYNQAGFNPEMPSKVSNKAEDNYIKLEPTGESGAVYAHGGRAKDIQEFSLHLPAIGNMMSDAWDIIHGPYRNDDMREFDTDGKNVSSLKGRLDSIDALEDDTIPVKRDVDGKLVGNKLNGGKTSTTDYTGKDDDEWIETLVNGNEETITIHHTYDLENKLNYKDIGHLEGKLNSNNDTTNNIDLNDGTNEFKINTPIVDSMGHVVGRNTETVTLPYGFKTIATNGRGTSTTENASTTPSNSNIVAESTQDILNINSGNKWIRMDTNASSDTLTIAHDIHETSSTTSTKTLVSETAVTTFDVPTYSFDDAGHYLSHDTKTITVPYGYGKITGDNGSTSATATFDTLAIKADDAWIETTVSEDKVNITHTGPVTGTPVTVANVEPEFGETFNITDWQYDSKGHKYGSTTHTVKMPDGSYTPANSATTHTDIITSLGFTPRTGAITSTKANTDTLTLYNYSANSGNLDIKSTDTINTGLEKIQNHINGLDMSSTSTTDFITSITQTDGKVAVTRAKAGTLVLGTQSTDKTVNADDSLNSAINKLEARIKAEEENRKAAIDTLYGNNGETISEAFDTIKEIADFLEQDDNNKQSGVEKIISDINANAYAIGAEELRATSAETNLATSITTEETRAKGAEQTLTTNLNNEISRAKGAEGTLTTNLNGEITRATNAETTLNTRITNLVGNTSVSAQIAAFGNTLGTAAKSDANDFAPAGYYDDRVLTSVYEAKIASLEGTIAALEARIAALEPQPEPPVSE